MENPWEHGDFESKKNSDLQGGVPKPQLSWLKQLGQPGFMAVITYCNHS